jgi:hypothetical protein
LSILTTKEEIEQLIGIQMRMGIVTMQRYQSFWATETRYGPVADVMSLKWYEKLSQYSHANDNALINTPENKGNRLYKAKPILVHNTS